MAMINGTSLDDYLSGTPDDDEINGLAGSDNLFGNSGNDILNGGDGNDLVWGGPGDDTLVGGAGDDFLGFLLSEEGANTWDGGEGSDTFAFLTDDAWTGNQLVTGGADSDHFLLVSRPSSPFQAVITDFSVAPGFGDILDVSNFAYYSGTENPFDPAEGVLTFAQQGADAVLLFDLDGASGPESWRPVATLQGVTATDITAWSLGGFEPTVLGDLAPVVHAPASANALNSAPLLFVGANALSITDADAGTGPEQVDLSVSHGVLTLASTAGLTFTVGDGSADTGMSFSGTLADINAALATVTYVPDSGYVGLDSVSIQAFDGTHTANANIALTVAPSFVPTISGDANDNTLFGTAGADVIFGFGGDDVLYGYGGDDVLDGGTGYNQLYGGDGADLLMVGTGGYGQLYGEYGDDTLIGSDAPYGYNSLDGGAGDDLLQGGAGYNYFADSQGANLFVGGPNNNTFDLVGWGWTADLQVVAGAGSDSFRLYWESSGYYGSYTAVVSGFASGLGGDQLDFDPFMSSAAENGGYTEGNPFGSLGYLRLQASGDDTLVQGDLDGAAGSVYGWQTLSILKNVAAASIVDANIAPANLFPLDGHTDPGIDWTGSDSGDYKAGTTVADVLHGANGGDQLMGYGGNDILDGGADNDYLWGGPGDDQLIGETGNDYLIGDQGNDVLQGGDGNDTLFGGIGNDVLDGGAGDDLLYLYVYWGGIQTVTSGPGRDTLPLYWSSSSASLVTDFSAEASGDILDFEPYLKYYAVGYTTGDPFGSLGYLRFAASTGDTLVQADRTGAADGAQWETLTVLQGVDPAAITTENVKGGYYTPVHTPIAADYGVTVPAGSEHIFTAGEFGYYDNQDHPFDHLVVVTLPAAGSLYVDMNSNHSIDAGEAVVAGASVVAAEIGHLTFQPAVGASGSPYASFDFKVNDGLSNSIQTYQMTINVFSEAAVPTGDGNGDGVADAAQANVDSFQAAVQTADGTPVVWATLAAPGDTAISNTSIQPVPADAPVNAELPYGMFSFDLAVPTPGISETMSIYLTGNWQMVEAGDFKDLDTGAQVNGYWKKGADGIWRNVAQLITTDDGKLRIDFKLTDGDPLTDSDGVANGIIADPGALGFMPNSAPELLPPQAVLPAGKEDTTYHVSSAQLLEGWSDVDNDELSIIGLNADHGSITASGDGYDFVPVADYNGPVTLSYQVSDGTLTADGTTLNFALVSVNDAPSFTAGADQMVPFGAGLQTVSDWASNLSAGPMDESGQILSFTVVNDHHALFAVQPFIDATGLLGYTPAAGASGSAEVTVTLKDNGGTDNGGNDSSLPVTFSITVEAPLNTPIGNVTDANPANNVVAENSPNGTIVGITALAVDPDAGNTVSYSLSNDAGGRFAIDPSSGVVTVVDGSKLNYEAQSSHGITALATSSDGTSSSESFTIDLLNVVEPTQTIKIGDAPTQLLRSAPKAWSDAWSNSALGLAISHKANYASGTEAWSAVTLDGLNAGVLTGGDLFSGDLGVSGQTAATSTTKQEIDGSEALRFTFASGVNAGTATLKLSRFHSNDDGSGYREAGRLQAFKDGALVGEVVFTADNTTGTRQVELSTPFGFDTLILTSGAYDTGHSFVAGAYANSDGTFGSAPYGNAGGVHGSDFLVDALLVGIEPLRFE